MRSVRSWRPLTGWRRGLRTRSQPSSLALWEAATISSRSCSSNILALLFLLSHFMCAPVLGVACNKCGHTSFKPCQCCWCLHMSVFWSEAFSAVVADPDTCCSPGGPIASLCFQIDMALKSNDMHPAVNDVHCLSDEMTTVHACSCLTLATVHGQ